MIPKSFFINQDPTKPLIRCLGDGISLLIIRHTKRNYAEKHISLQRGIGFTNRVIIME